MAGLAEGSFWLMVATIVLLMVAMGLMIAAQRKARATLLTDLGWKAAVLFTATIYIEFVADHAESFGGDPMVFTLAVRGAYVLMAAFLALLGYQLYRFTKKDGMVIVTPEFLVALRHRTQAMYGPGPTRFISYAVGKESAQKAVRAHVDSGLSTSEKMWRRIPHLFHVMGYGRLRFVSGKPGENLTVEIAGTFENVHPIAREGCDLTRGYLAGLGEALAPGQACEAEETRCGTKWGDHTCTFEMRWFPKLDPAKVPVVAPDPGPGARPERDAPVGSARGPAEAS